MTGIIGEVLTTDNIENKCGLHRGSVLNGIEWKIHYFSYVSLCQYNTNCRSSEFKLFGSKWYLEIRPTAVCKIDDVQWFGLYLCRNDYSNSHIKKNIEFTFGIRKNDGVIHNIRSGKNVFQTFAMRAGVLNFFRRFARKNPCDMGDIFNCDNCLIIFCVMDESSETTVSKDQDGSIGVDTEWNCSEDKESDDQEEELKHEQGIVTFCEDMKKLFQSQQLCDVKILVNGEEFQAHKAILAARSPVFSSMFAHEMKEKKSDFVEISDSKLDVFKEFLYYLYTGSIQKISLKHVCGVYVLADKYNVNQLARQCIDLMMEKLSVDNFCDFISLAIKYKESKLLSTTTEYFVENAKSILLTVQWQSFIAENPTVANELFLKTLTLK